MPYKTGTQLVQMKRAKEMYRISNNLEQKIQKKLQQKTHKTLEIKEMYKMSKNLEQKIQKQKNCNRKHIKHLRKKRCTK